MSEQTYLTISDVMKELGRRGIDVSRRTMERMIKRREFPTPIFVGQRRHWPASVIDAWLDRKQKEAA